MSSSATGVGMPICFLWAILLILTQKSSQKFGDVLGIIINGVKLNNSPASKAFIPLARQPGIRRWRKKVHPSSATGMFRRYIPAVC